MCVYVLWVGEQVVDGVENRRWKGRGSEVQIFQCVVLHEHNVVGTRLYVCLLVLGEGYVCVHVCVCLLNSFKHFRSVDWFPLVGVRVRGTEDR